MSEHALVTDPADNAAENRLAARILMITLLVLVAAGAIVGLLGLPALGIVGLAATAACFALMIGFMLGS